MHPMIHCTLFPSDLKKKTESQPARGEVSGCDEVERRMYDILILSRRMGIMGHHLLSE